MADHIEAEFCRHLTRGIQVGQYLDRLLASRHELFVRMEPVSIQPIAGMLTRMVGEKTRMIESRVSDYWCFLLAGTLLALALTPILASAMTDRVVIVDPIADDDPDSGCTLREAIDLANAGLLSAIGCTATESGTGLPLNYRLELPAYTYNITGTSGEDNNSTGDLDVFSTVSIIGVGTESTVIDGDGLDRLFHVTQTSFMLFIDGVTLQNGHANDGGGAILNNGGTLGVSHCQLIGNVASGSDGGAIENSGGTLIVDESMVSDNFASNGGGGIQTRGGGSFGLDSVTITSSHVVRNNARIGGGIRVVSDGTVAIFDTTVSDNVASSGGGGIYASFQNGSNTGALNVLDSSIVGNVAVFGAGITNFMRLNIANSSIVGNMASGNGGGLYASGTSHLTHMTIARNMSDQNNSGSGDGGGIFHGGGLTTLKNTIVTENVDRGGERPDCSGSISSMQFNLIGINSGCATSFFGGSPNSNNDFVGTAGIPLDARLGLITDTPNFLSPEIDSPVINKVLPVDCQYISVGSNPLYGEGEPVTTDQRGAPRDDALCDIGAVESQLLFSNGFE